MLWETSCLWSCPAFVHLPGFPAVYMLGLLAQGNTSVLSFLWLKHLQWFPVVAKIMLSRLGWVYKAFYKRFLAYLCSFAQVLCSFVLTFVRAAMLLSIGFVLFLWDTLASTQLTPVHSSNPTLKVAWFMKLALMIPGSMRPAFLFALSAHCTGFQISYLFCCNCFVFRHCPQVKWVLLTGDYFLFILLRLEQSYSQHPWQMDAPFEHCQEWEKSLDLMRSIFAQLFNVSTHSVNIYGVNYYMPGTDIGTADIEIPKG